MKKITLSAAAVLSLATLPSAVSAADGFSLFSDAKFSGEIRPRYEYVEVDKSTKNDANAMTVRAVLGMEAKLLGIDGLSVKVEGTTVQTLGDTRYDNDPLATRGDARYQVVADPEQTRFTQAYLQYKYGATAIKAGRQIVNLDNQRFVGSVDWRQMPQTFDAVVLSNTSIAGLTLIGAYVDKFETVFDRPTVDTSSVILNGSYKVSDMLKVTAYDYMLSSIHDTMGMALTGVVPVSAAKVDYRAEYAKQSDPSRDTGGGAKNVNADAYYYNLEATANMNGLSAGVGYEFLSGTTGTDGKTAFSTPLATLHKFNGWADKFLVTPAGGIQDASLSLGYGAQGLGKAMAVYHKFDTDCTMAGKSDLGSEYDLMYTNAIPGIKGLNGLAKAAYFKAGDVAGFNADVTKFWLQLDYKF
ncbi:MAG: OprD family outer membrane porin [Sulfuricurvum sp.]